MSPELSEFITGMLEESPNDKLVIGPENFSRILFKMWLESLSPELKLEVLEYLKSGLKKDETELYIEEGKNVLPIIEKKEKKSEKQAYKLHLNILRDPHSLDKFDDEMKLKEVIGADLGVLKKRGEPNIMIVLGFIIIIAESKKHFKTRCKDKYGREIIITSETIKKALLKKHKIKDNKMMRRDPDECIRKAKAYLQSVRDWENSTINYFNK